MKLRRRFRVAGLAAAAAVIGMTAIAPVALAHPLGNFTINHYAGLRIAPDRIALDVVIDRAEIPAFQELQRLAPDGGPLSAEQAIAAGREACSSLAGDLHLTVGGSRVATPLVASGLSFPPGAGDLPTMRLVCAYDAPLSAPIEATTEVAFEDRSFAERVGWREIVALGDRVTIDDPVTMGAGAQVEPGGIADRLTSYPGDLLAQPLDVRALTVEVRPGGPALEPWAAPDATPLAGVAGGGPDRQLPAAVGAVPGGIAEDLAGLIDVANLSPLTIVAALAIAFGLGIIHALSPGHGKTIMAAYLVGGRGSTRQAIGLGLAVAISHTLGVLALAVITMVASSILPPERLYPILGLVSGALVIVIGASLLWSRLRVLRSAEGHGDEHEHPHAHPHAHPHGHPHPHPHSRDLGHEHPHDHAPADDQISWRGLVALGLSGGLVPSASALILLLGSIAAGVPAYGLVLVLAFGLGMAVVLGGIGFALVHARRLLEGRRMAGRFERLALPIQVGTASIVVVLGVALTGQALGQVL